MKQGLLSVLVIDFTNQTDLVEHDTLKCIHNNVKEAIDETEFILTRLPKD